jgi:hypothetical protein
MMFFGVRWFFGHLRVLQRQESGIWVELPPVVHDGQALSSFLSLTLIATSFL